MWPAGKSKSSSSSNRYLVRISSKHVAKVQKRILKCKQIIRNLQWGLQIFHIASLSSSPQGGTVRGSLFYLSIAGDVEAPLSFAIIRDGETIATTGEMMTYEANGISGSPAQPTQISFVRTDKLPQQGWYTLDGIKLPTAPKRSGVYLYNGKKQVIQ
jgi:hypothetical protein